MIIKRSTFSKGAPILRFFDRFVIIDYLESKGLCISMKLMGTLDISEQMN